MGIKSLFKHLLLTTAVLSIYACGGGGGESSHKTETIIEVQKQQSTNLVFADQKLTDCVQALIDSEGYTLVEEIKQLTCSGKEIVDIEGIQNLSSLEILNLSNNQIRDITPISKLGRLKQLYLQGNNLQLLSPIAANQLLEQVDISNNDAIICSEQTKLEQSIGEENLTANQPCLEGMQQAETATFEDPNLQACIRQTAQDIGALHLEQIQQLKCVNYAISDIDGIDLLRNLRELDLTQNNISDITPLQGLALLKKVLLGKNQISNTQALTTSKYMQELRLDYNQLTDIQYVQKLTALRQIHLTNNQIRDLTPLQSLTGLLELRISNNRIIDIDSLANLPKLSSLWIQGNQIADLTPLQPLQNLEQLWLSNNWLTDLTPLQTQSKLKWLHLDGTEAADLNPLNKLTQLKWLQLDNTRVDDITAIYPLTQLDWLHLKGNNTIPCSQLDHMEEILTPEKIDRPETCSQPQEQTGNPISTIEFQDEDLRDCIYDAAREQGVTNAEELTTLSCPEADITDITELTQFPGITSIDLTGNNHISCAQLDDLRERYGYRYDEGGEYEYEAEAEAAAVALILPESCNNPPSINTQTEQIVETGTQVDLNAEATDPNGDSLTYNWQQTAGQSVQLTSQNTATPSFTAPEGEDQTITIQLTVTDQYGLSTAQAINILVTGAILGSKDNPFLVTNYADLKKVGTGIDGWNLDSHYLQTADIDATPSKTENPIPDTEEEYYGFIPIGRIVPEEIGDEMNQFTGSYGGGGFAIDGLMINMPSGHTGLFAFAFNSSFSNISLSNIDINGLSIVGGLAGQFVATDGIEIKLENISVSGSFKGGSYFGGVFGQVASYENSSLLIDNIHANVNISTSNGDLYNVGGVVGYLTGYNINIIQSSAIGSFDGLDNLNAVGGLVGNFTGENISVIDCSSNVNISASEENPYYQHVGGMIGVYSGSNLTYSNNSSSGQIELESFSDDIGFAFYVGGLIGTFNVDEGYVSVINNYSSGDIKITGIDSYFLGGMIGRLVGKDITFIHNYSENQITLNSLRHEVIGGLAGALYGGNIVLSDSYATGNIQISGNSIERVGGLVGQLAGDDVNVSNVFASGDMITSYAEDCLEHVTEECGRWAGGLIGHAAKNYLQSRVDIRNAYATGNISGDTKVGGLIGEASEGVSIENSYARGNVTGNSQVGGLVGQMTHSDGNDETPAAYSTITNSYSTGQVKLQNEELEPIDFGGLVGASTSELNTVSNSFWDIETSGLETSAGGEPKTSEELKTTTTFTNAGWDFDETWMILSEGYTYPRLAWNTIEIESWTDLNNMRNNMHANYVLTRDLFTTDADYVELAGPEANEGKGWEPVGTSEKPFMGTFDGGGFTIDGLTINRPEECFQGLFGFSKDTTLANISLDNISLKALCDSGALVGAMVAYESVISNSHVSGYLEPGGGDSGGVVGLISGVSASIVNSSFDGTVVAGNLAGGFLGSFNGARLQIVDSHSSGLVQWNDLANDVGGFVGQVGGSFVSILNSYSSTNLDFGDVSDVGGFIGRVSAGNLEIINSHSSGDIEIDTGGYAAGGFAGSSSGFHVIRNSYSTSDINITEGGNIVGGFIAISSGSYDIDGLYSTSNITLESGSLSQSGGLFGILAGGGTLNRMYATGNISAPEGMMVGGLIGRLDNLPVSNSYAQGVVVVENGDYIGGLIGQVSSEISVIENSYSSGLVIGAADSEYVGGLIGNDNEATVINSFWDIETSGQETSAGGIGLATEEMQNQYTYESAEWDFDSVWGYNYGEYPFLQESNYEIVRTKFQSGQYQGTYNWDCGDGVNTGSTSIALNLRESGGAITGTAEYLGSTIAISYGIYSDITGYISFDLPASEATVRNYFSGVYAPEDPGSKIFGTTYFGETEDLEGCRNDYGTAGTMSLY